MPRVAASRAAPARAGGLLAHADFAIEQGERTGPKEGEARVAEWRRVGAKRVLGDVGRGGGASVPKRAA